MGAALTVATILLLAAAVRATSSPVLPLAALALVVPFGSTVSFPGPPLLANVSSVAAAVTVAAYAAHLLLSERPPLRPGPETPVWGLLVAFAALTTLWSIRPEQSLTGAFVLASLVVLYVLVSITPATPADLRVLDIALVLSGALAGMYAVYLAATGVLAGAVDQRFVAAIGGSEVSDVADPNITAASLLLPFFVATHRALRPGPTTQRAAYLAAAALTTVAIFLTGSRGGLLALIAGLLLMVWSSAHRGRALALVAVPALAVVLAVGVAPAHVVERVSGDSRTSGRTDIWQIGARACPEYCVTGSGWATFPDVHEEGWLEEPESRGLQRRFEAHSIWLGLLIEAGVLALGLVLVALMFTWRRTTRMPLGDRAAPQAALLATLVAATLLSTFSFKYFWLVLVYVAVTHNACREVGADAVPVTSEKVRTA